MATRSDLLIVGAGIFGVTAALALRKRGYEVTLLDPGPLPHPLAASTDISKVIRMEYGTDEAYMEMVEEAINTWKMWNARWDEPLYHETGVVMLSRQPMAPGSYEYESFQMLLRRGHHPERLDSTEIERRYPAWKTGAFVDGFFHPVGGFAESGRVVAALLEQAQQDGVVLRTGTKVTGLTVNGTRVSGVETSNGDRYEAAETVIAAGSWTYLLVPGLAPFMKATGHPVFHLAPVNEALFMPPSFVVFTADVARTGWYGFPLHPREKVVKIANHGVGLRLDPVKDARAVTQEDEAALRDFLRDTFPALAEAPIVYTRRCLYADTLDEHFWIDRHPELAGLSVATGGSGHGFKFAPLLGDLIADAVEAISNPWLGRFQWRELEPETSGEEAARRHA